MPFIVFNKKGEWLDIPGTPKTEKERAFIGMPSAEQFRQMTELDISPIEFINKTIKADEHENDIFHRKYDDDFVRYSKIDGSLVHPAIFPQLDLSRIKYVESYIDGTCIGGRWKIIS